jgi:hypothetical protein
VSNSTPQGPGPEFGSNPDGTPIDEETAVQEAMDEESAAVAGEDDVIDLADPAGPELTGGAQDDDSV